MSKTQDGKAYEKMILSLVSKMKANANNKEPIFVTDNLGKQILGDRIAGFNVISNEVEDDDEGCPKEHWLFGGEDE